MSGVNANLPIPIATASDSVPDSAMTSAREAPVFSVGCVIQDDGDAVCTASLFVASAREAIYRPVWHMSEGRIGRTLAATRDQIQMLVAFKI